MDTVSRKQKQLQDLADQIVKDNICPELAAQATQLVMGDGNADADVVFIGEAPGKNEDIQGKPFVGAAGKFLNEMLEAIGLQRGEVYITNIVKYRPPNNRDPWPEEKTAFLPYLQAQLDIIQPEVVVTLGRHSMNCFLPDLQISQVHGQPKRISIAWKHQGNTQDITKLVILPLFHPAAALYNGAMRETLMEDFAKIPSVIKKVKAFEKQ